MIWIGGIAVMLLVAVGLREANRRIGHAEGKRYQPIRDGEGHVIGVLDTQLHQEEETELAHWRRDHA